MMTSDSGPYSASWKSLMPHTTPYWMHNTKFGIHWPWGPAAVQTANRDKDITTLEAIEQWHGERDDA